MSYLVMAWCARSGTLVRVFGSRWWFEFKRGETRHSQPAFGDAYTQRNARCAKRVAG